MPRKGECVSSFPSRLLPRIMSSLKFRFCRCRRNKNKRLRELWGDRALYREIAYLHRRTAVGRFMVRGRVVWPIRRRRENNMTGTEHEPEHERQENCEICNGPLQFDLCVCTRARARLVRLTLREWWSTKIIIIVKNKTPVVYFLYGPLRCPKLF